MSMEDSDDEIDDLPALAAKAHSNLGRYPQISGWENDTDGIEESRNPDGNF